MCFLTASARAFAFFIFSRLTVSMRMLAASAENFVGASPPIIISPPMGTSVIHFDLYRASSDMSRV